jgi:hypothetical protein
MPNQPSAALIGADITAGNGVLYYAPTFFTSFTDAKASTAWRKMGMMKSAANIGISREYLEFFSGVPAALVQTYITAEDITISGDLLEGRPENIARILGGVNLVRTVKASAPAPTTVAASSTKTLINLTSATGYKAGDEIRVGAAPPYQYGRIKTLTGNAATLYQGLDLDITPTPGDEVAKVDTSTMDLGALAAPANVALKFSYTMLGGYGSFDLIVLKAQFKSNFDLAFQDNTRTPEGIGFSFTATGIKDADVEGGIIAQWVATHA